MTLNYSCMEGPCDTNCSPKPTVNHRADISHAAGRGEEGGLSHQEQQLQNSKLRSKTKEDD